MSPAASNPSIPPTSAPAPASAPDSGPASGPPAALAAASPSILATAGGLLLISALGLMCFLLPTIVAGTPLEPAPLFPLLRTSVEHLHWATFVGLACIGFIAGLLTRWPVALIAAASVIALPTAMFLEIAKDGTSHNLLPFELVMYAAFALPPLALAMMGRMLRQHRRAATEWR